MNQFYLGTVNTSVLEQGDVVDNFPLIHIADPLEYLQESAGVYKIESGGVANILRTSEKIVLTIKPHKVALLSQTCDLLWRERIMAAPIFSFNEMKEKGILNVDKRQSVKDRKNGVYFYLPEEPGVLEESMISFERMFALPRAEAEKYKSNKVLSLSDWGKHHLGWALSQFFGRPIEDKDK